MNTIALILAIAALGTSITALVVALRKKETLIESQSDSNLGSNEAQLGSDQDLNPDPGNVTTIENPYMPVDDIYVISGKKGGKS